MQETRLEMAEAGMRMLRWMCGVTRKNKTRNTRIVNSGGGGNVDARDQTEDRRWKKDAENMEGMHWT